MMKQLKITKGILLCVVLLTGLIGFTIGFKVSESNVQKEVSAKIDTVLTSDIMVKKGNVYVRDFVIDINDPFGQKCSDTVTVLDLKTSTSKDNLVYVKWTFNKWNDTTKYISSELNFFTKGLRKL